MMKTPRLAGLLAFARAEKDEEKPVTYDYDALTPSIMEEQDAQHYIEALNFACHRADIKNIAVTGPYGAGKSSVLITWSQNRKADLKIMTVSLADFDMIKAGDNSDNKKNENSVTPERKASQEEKSIEYSILQQLLYKARKIDLPYSRIERIAHVTPAQTRVMAWDLLATLSTGLSGLVCLFPDYFREKLSLPISFSEFLLSVPSVIRVGLFAGVAFFITFYLILGKLHRMGVFDRRVSIDKIDLMKGATVSTRPPDPSLLNVYIDEIVYFFEKQKYNVVIFEDLDRHNDGGIFIKLREINKIINNCLPTENPVRFIYAVRDDIFHTPEARTKFFDFVMPVIPVMDSQNATEHFSSKFRQIELEIPEFEQCVARLAIFIPDMRVLNSIANEFRLYRNLVSNGENIIRLLSLIAYKNLCAQDYHLIDSKRGVLYGVMNAYISGKLKHEHEFEISQKIIKLDKERNSINNETAKNKEDIIEDLLSVYISNKTKQHIKFATHNGATYHLDQVIKDENIFLTMIKSTGLYIRTNSYGLNISDITPSTSEEILNNYKIRCECLDSKLNGRVSAINKILEQLNQEKDKLRVRTPGALIQKMGDEKFKEWVSEHLGIAFSADSTEGYNSTQFDFIFSLLRWDYLSTDYMSYRSVFIPGSLSSNDNNFIRAVSAGKDYITTGAMPLDKIANVITKLKDIGLLLQENSWHPEILLYLLTHDTKLLTPIMKLQVNISEQQRLIALTKQIFKDWKIENCIRYVQLMVTQSGEPAQFIYYLSEFSDKEVALQLMILLMCANNSHWHDNRIDIHHHAMNILDRYDNITEMVPDGYADIFAINMKRVRITLSKIGINNTNQGREVIKEIVERQLWLYSKENLRNITSMLSERNIEDELSEKPITTVESFNIYGLNETIKENIDYFVLDYFIHSKEYTRAIGILNNSSVTFKTLNEMIMKMDFIVDEAWNVQVRDGTVESTDGTETASTVHALLLQYDRLRVDWATLEYLLLHIGNLDPWLAEWFARNYHNFSLDGKSSYSLEFFDALTEKLVIWPAIGNEALNTLLTRLEVYYISLPEGIPLKNAKLLLKQKRLAPTLTVFEEVYQAFISSGETLTPLLADLVLQRPTLLETDPELILIKDGKFDRPLATILLTSKAIPEDVRINSLNWLWGYDPDLFKGPQFISSDDFSQLAPKLTNDVLRRELLIQCLDGGKLSHRTTAQVLSLLADADYQSFLSNKAHRSVVYTEPLRKMADLLASSGFIQSLKFNEEHNRIRFVPHNSPAFKR